MSAARDEFFRRYATSPIHVPRLERLLNVYEDDDEDDAFSRRFIAWDRACPDIDAARIVTEIISMSVGVSGRIVRLSDSALKGAIRWMAEATSYSVPDRARILGESLSSVDERARTHFIESLERLTTDHAEIAEHAEILFLCELGVLCVVRRASGVSSL